MSVTRDSVIFAFDTCSSQDSLALHLNNTTYKKTLPGGTSSDQSSRLLPEIIQFLSEHRLSITDINTLLTLSGPGSFTGIRLGLATAQGLVFKRAVKAMTATKFTLMAHQFSLIAPKVTRFLTLVPKNREEYYYALYNDSLAPAATDICDLNHELIIHSKLPCLIAGAPLLSLNYPLPEVALIRNNAADLVDLYLNKGIDFLSPELVPSYVHNPEFKKQARFIHD